MALADIRWSSQPATPIQSLPLPLNGAHATLAPLGGPLLKRGSSHCTGVRKGLMRGVREAPGDMLTKSGHNHDCSALALPILWQYLCKL